jgi:polysaccharide biosynthesis/export protein
MRAAFLFVMAMALPTLAVSCRTVAPAHTPERLAGVVQFQTSAPVTVFEPGALVEFRFAYQPELNDTQKVRRDGKVTLPFLGDVLIAGLAPAEVGEQLRKAYEGQLRDPSIAVILREDPSLQVLVGGAVAAPGPVPLSHRLTVLDAMLIAGGPDLRTANVRNVIVIRGAGDQRTGYAMDLGPTLAGEPSAPFYLEPRDIVYVPRTEIVETGQWIDQYISSIVPQLGITYDRPVGSGTFGIDTAVRRFGGR